MRTTLVIDDDVLAADSGLAGQRRVPVGAVIAALAREALQRTPGKASTRHGVPLLPIRPRATPATLDVVNRLCDELA